MTPEESILLSEFGAAYYYQLSALICTCSFYGIYLIAAFIAFYLILHKGLAGRSRKVLLTCLVFVFFTNTWTFVNKSAANLIEIKVALVRNQSGGDLAAQISDASAALLPWQYMLNWPITLNLIISDGIVAWRAAVIWSGDKLIKWCLAFVMLGNIVVNILDCVFDDIALNSFWQTSSWDSAAAFISFGLNFIATLLIAFKAWQHHETMKALLTRRRTHVEAILLLFVESGTAYGILQLTYSILIVLSVNSSGTTPLVIARSIIIEFFSAASAMYPVAVILMVNLDCSPLDETFQLEDAVDDGATGTTETKFSSLQFAQRPNAVEEMGRGPRIRTTSTADSHDLELQRIKQDSL